MSILNHLICAQGRQVAAQSAYHSSGGTSQEHDIYQTAKRGEKVTGFVDPEHIVVVSLKRRRR